MIKTRQAVPDWIKPLRAPGYTNPFEIAPAAPTGYGTEQFLGDWSGKLLLLAQDFAPAAKLRSLKEDGLTDARVYRHSDGDSRFGQSGLKTNRAIARAAFVSTLAGLCRKLCAGEIGVSRCAE